MLKVHSTTMKSTFSYSDISHGDLITVQRHDASCVRYNLVTMSKYIFCLSISLLT